MGNLIYTVGGSSNLVSCKSAAKVPFESLKVEFAPVQSGSGDPSPSNVRPISGWTGVNVTQCGKNLYNETLYPVTNGYWINYATGEYLASSGYAATSNYIPFENYDGMILTLNKRPGGANTGIAFYSGMSTSERIGGVRNSGGTAGTPITFTVPNGTKYMRFTVPENATGIQIELGSNATQYELYTSTTHPLSWQSEAGTVYGGYVDLVSGVLVAKWKMIDLGTLDYGLFGNSTRRQAWQSDGIIDSYPINSVGTVPQWFSPQFKAVSNNTTWYPYMMAGQDGNAPHRLYLTFPQSSYENSTQVKTAVSGIPLVYLLETPITYQLAPLQLTTLLGRNNIWSNANGNTTVSYPLVETGAIREAKRRVYQFMSSGEVLPPEYQKVDWIENYYSQASLKVTGIEFDDPTMVIDFTMKMLVRSNYIQPFGNYYNEQTRCWRICQFLASDTNLRGVWVTFGRRRAGASPRLDIVPEGEDMLNKKINYNFEYGKVTSKYGNYVATATADATLDYPMSTSTFMIGRDGRNRFYHFKIMSKGKIIRNYIPCYRKSDNKVGFYDTVNHTFNPSTGSKEFTCGNDT